MLHARFEYTLILKIFGDQNQSSFCTNNRTMSPVVIRNQMRTRSVSRADAADISMKKSASIYQRPRRRSHVDDETIMTKTELARTIAEFRVGFTPSSTMTNGSNGVMEIVDDMDTNVDETEKTDSQKDDLAQVNYQSLPTPAPVTNYDTSETHPVNHIQSTTIQFPYSLQTPRLDESDGSASLEVEPSASSRPTGSHRRGFTSCEKELLEAAFHIADNPGTATMKLLVHLTGLDKKKIRGWFRTRRIRQEREEANLESSENTTSSVAEPKHHQVPPQYWPEPLRFSHMQRSYPVPGYNYLAPSGIPPMMTPGLPPMAPGIPSLTPGIPSLPSKVPPSAWYPPPPAAPTMGFLPPPPSHWYPPLGFHAGLPPHPTITKNGPLSLAPSGLPVASQATPPTGAPKAPTGPWYPSPPAGHPLQGVIPQSVPTPNAPSGLLPGGFLHPWSSVGCYPAPGATPQHPGATPYPPHPALPYFSPWYPILPAPNTLHPAHRQSGARTETPAINDASTSQTVKRLPSQVTIQEVSEAESEAASTA